MYYPKVVLPREAEAHSIIDPAIIQDNDEWWRFVEAILALVKHHKHVASIANQFETVDQVFAFAANNQHTFMRIASEFSYISDEQIALVDECITNELRVQSTEFPD